MRNYTATISTSNTSDGKFEQPTRYDTTNPKNFQY